MKAIALCGLLLLIPSVAYAADSTCNKTDHFAAETGFYSFVYNRNLHGLESRILPANYTGRNIAFGFRPFCRVTFEVGYFANWNTLSVSVGGKSQVYAQSTVQFHVWILRAVVNLFTVPWTHKTLTVNGILSVSQLKYNGAIQVGYRTPNKSGSFQLMSVAGEESGPAIGIGLTYHPGNSPFQIGMRRTQYTYGNGTDANLTTFFIQYWF